VTFGGFPDLSSPAVPAGTRLNGIFEIDRQIGAGGMGEIYKGHGVETGDVVAIKIIRSDLAQNESALALFRKEASILHNLLHEAIVRYYVFSVDPALRRPYFVMEFVDGEPLSQRLLKGPLSYETVRALMKRLASGLQVAHEHGVVHRDISPDNVILPGGEVERAKIIDFGIARSADIGGATIIGGGFAGKYNYVSPEQLGLYGGDVTGRSDIYSLGLVLTEALTGRAIDMGGSPAQVVEKRQSVPDLSQVDVRMRPLLEKMLQPQPDARPPSMAAVASWSSDFTAYPDGPGQRGSKRPGASPEARVPSQRRVRRAGLITASLVALVAVGAAVAVLDPLGLWSTPPGSSGAASPDLVLVPPPAVEPAKPPPAPTPPSTPAESPSPAVARPAAATPASGPPETTPQSSGPAASAAGPAAPGSAAVVTPPPPVERPSVPVPGPAPPATVSPVPPAVTPPVTPEAHTGSKPATAAQVTDYLQRYPVGDCALIVPKVVQSGDSLQVDIKFIGDSREAAEALDTAFRVANGIEPKIIGGLVTPEQCPAVEFLRHVSTAQALDLNLDGFALRGDEKLTGSVREQAGQKTALLAVSARGQVSDLTGDLRKYADGMARFETRLPDTGSQVQQPSMLLAVSVPQDVPLPSTSLAADAYFPALFLAGQKSGASIAAAVEYLKVGG
jgi:serine/threonine protein kinase